MEQIDLTTPEPYPLPTKTVASWKPDELHLQWTAQHIGIVLRGSGGERREVHINGETAKTLMAALNKANLTTKSLHKRVLEYLVANDHLEAGTITGEVD